MAMSAEQVREILPQEALAEVFAKLDVAWTVQESFDDLKKRMEQNHEAYASTH